MVDISAQFFTAVWQVLVTALAALGLTATAQWQLWGMRGKKFLSGNAFSRVTTVAATVDDRSAVFDGISAATVAAG